VGLSFISKQYNYDFCKKEGGWWGEDLGIRIIYNSTVFVKTNVFSIQHGMSIMES